MSTKISYISKVIIIDSENFTKTKVYKNVISKEDVDILNDEAIKILQEIYTHKTNQYGFRVYLGYNTLEKLDHYLS